MARLSADGTKILENYCRFTGVSFNANVTTVYANGSTMDDSKVDNCVYFKNTEELGGGYSVRSEFIENRTVNVTWFGAVGDGVTDNLNSFDRIQAFLRSVNPKSSGKMTLVFPTSMYGFVTTGQFIIPNNVNVIMLSGILYTGPKDKSVLKIGSSSGNNEKVRLQLDVRSSTGSWLNENYIGIEIYNLYESTDVTILRSNGFTEGVRFIGDSSGFSYNTITLGQLMNNKIAIKLTSINSGWVNENLILGGRFQRTTGTNTTLSMFGVVITSQDGSYTNNNNNNFYKPSFELKGGVSAETLPILIEHGNQNAFKDIRNENDTIPCLIRTLNESTDNSVTIGFNSGSANINSLVQDLGSAPNTLVDVRKGYITSCVKKQSYNSEDLSSRLFNYDSDSFYSPDELYLISSAATTSTLSKNSSNFSYGSRGVVIPSSRGVLVRIDARLNKRFVITKFLISGSNGGRINVRPLDSSFNIITPSGTPLIKGLASNVPAYSSNFGGVYRQGTDTPSPFYINVDTSVSYIDVIFSGGSSSSSTLQSFCIESIDERFNVLDLNFRRGFYSSEAPTVTSFPSGTVVYNANPLLYSNVGWVLSTNSGIKAWQPFGFISVLPPLSIGSTSGIPIPPTAEIIDANLVEGTNVAYLSASSTNMPTSVTSGGFLDTGRYSTGTGSAFQVFKHTGLEDSFWFRKKQGSNEWGTWFQVASRQFVATNYTPQSIIDATSTPYTKATINAAYPSATKNTIIIQDGANMTYIKKDNSPTGNWSTFPTVQLT